jgi:acetylornithine deacetylase/succinyl-diaminopimelate desuccinylase-like protein
MPDDFIRLLTDTFNSVTGLQAAPAGAGGGTAARSLPRAVSFGPCYPGEKCMMHVENEYRGRERFLTDIQLITEVIIRGGNY